MKVSFIIISNRTRLIALPWGIPFSFTLWLHPHKTLVLTLCISLALWLVYEPDIHHMQCYAHLLSYTWFLCLEPIFHTCTSHFTFNIVLQCVPFSDIRSIEGISYQEFCSLVFILYHQTTPIAMFTLLHSWLGEEGGGLKKENGRGFIYFNQYDATWSMVTVCFLPLIQYTLITLPVIF